ncbi:MAG: nucleotidyltransferase domain-containing protein, partial [Gammaproteobacteria bacterium]
MPLNTPQVRATRRPAYAPGPDAFGKRCGPPSRGLGSQPGSPSVEAAEADLDTVRAILRAHVPGHEVWAFGSRARRCAKRYSDLDLVIVGLQPLSLDVLAALNEAFADSDLPWKVDVVDWARI